MIYKSSIIAIEIAFINPPLIGNDDYPKINEWKMASYGLFWKLLVSSNQQMRETLLNSIINQIRYPNPITFYFTNLIFYIFSVPSSDDNLLEQIIKYLFFPKNPS